MLKKTIVLFVIGGTLYMMLEILFRGFTHITMFAAGGTCLCLIYYVCNRSLAKYDMFIKCAVGSAIITGVELITGYIVNIRLGLNVWDYSYHPYNYLGQICLTYTAIWFFLTLPIMLLCRLFDLIVQATKNSPVKIIRQYPSELIRLKQPLK